MTDSKHTPGPWSIYGKPGDYPGIEAGQIPFSVVVFGFPDEYHPCGIQGRDSNEMQANARLIAAAPDLLEALRTCVAVIEIQQRFCESTAEGKAAWDETLDHARAAIAKATGNA